MKNVTICPTYACTTPRQRARARGDDRCDERGCSHTCQWKRCLFKKNVCRVCTGWGNSPVVTPGATTLPPWRLGGGTHPTRAPRKQPDPRRKPSRTAHGPLCCVLPDPESSLLQNNKPHDHPSPVGGLIHQDALVFVHEPLLRVRLRDLVGVAHASPLGAARGDAAAATT